MDIKLFCNHNFSDSKIFHRLNQLPEYIELGTKMCFQLSCRSSTSFFELLLQQKMKEKQNLFYFEETHLT